MVDGFGLACLLAVLPSFEDYSRWLARGSMGYVIAHGALVAFGCALLLGTSAAYWIWRRRPPGAAAWLVAGLDIIYLFIPLYHHLFWSKDQGSWTDPGYFVYMPDADNYFARRVPVQLAVWAAVVGIVLGLTRLRARLVRQRVG
jgi:hypothetical protein